jgi:RNA-directed DNA polymerase
MLDKKANIFKVRYLYGKHRRRCGGHKCRRCVRITRGDLLYLPYVLPPSQGGGMGEQKSAEGILGLFDKAEGPNMKVPEDGLSRFDDEGGAAKMVEIPDTHLKDGRRNLSGSGQGAPSIAAPQGTVHPEEMKLIEAVVERENMKKALKRVMANKGAPGVDGMRVEELTLYLKENWQRIKEELLRGNYLPSPVLLVEIPKAGGKGTRSLGIPTVLDRLIQQAILQVLTPLFDPMFSQDSFGFRPGKSAHQAILKAKSYVMEGKRWVVDIDIEQFFDRVNHDILMAKVAHKVADKRILKLIRRYLKAGIMIGGVTSPRVEGAPQGGPLSPLLSNVLLDELDKELERRGHAFVRYADDANVYVKSKAAAERVMVSITRFLEKRLKLKVNTAKSATDRPWRRKFLGYSMSWHKVPRLRVAPEAVARFRSKVKAIFRRGRGHSLKSDHQGTYPAS